MNSPFPFGVAALLPGGSQLGGPVPPARNSSRGFSLRRRHAHTFALSRVAAACRAWGLSRQNSEAGYHRLNKLADVLSGSSRFARGRRRAFRPFFVSRFHVSSNDVEALPCVTKRVSGASR